MIVVLLIFAFGAGCLVLRALGGWPARDTESLALAGAAGLGTTALLLALLALTESLNIAPWMIGTGALLTLVYVAPILRSIVAWSKPWRAEWHASPPTVLLLLMLGAAVLGAMAPVTETDSLAYPMPIAQHLADAGAWRFWPDQVLSVFPLSQEMLLVPLVQTGTHRLGLLSAVELVLAALLIVALARRVTSRRDAPAIAAIITLGCPAVAFMAASAKADLLLLVMTTAAAVSLVSDPGRAVAARVGLFAGFAAGTKLTGVPIALATIGCVPWCCGRRKPVRDLAIAALVASAAGGLWYVVNFARFGNPVPLMSLGPWFAPPLIPPDVLTNLTSGFGRGRSVVDAIIAPAYLAFGSELFGGRGNWINALPFLGLGAALTRGLRRHAWVLTSIAGVGYIAWFSQIQVARLLLPVLALLSVPAADLLARAWQSSRLARAGLAAVLLASAGVVAATGIIRLERYVREPSTFLARETPYYDAIAWMNAHLDPNHDRVGASFEPAGYLRVPWLTLNATYQTEITADELDDAAQVRAALARAHITYVFGPPDAFQKIAASLELVYENAHSRVGGSSFFREPRVAPIAVYRVR